MFVEIKTKLEEVFLGVEKSLENLLRQNANKFVVAFKAKTQKSFVFPLSSHYEALFWRETEKFSGEARKVLCVE